MFQHRTEPPSKSGLTPAAGSSSGSFGSGAIDGWQRTSRLSSTPHAFLYAAFVIRRNAPHLRSKLLLASTFPSAA